MPFTFAHAVVALPFRRTRVPVAAVAAGAMVPDLPLFAPIGVPYAVTHEVWAAPTVDVLLGLLLLVLWGVVLRPALMAALPLAVAARLPESAQRPTVPRPAPALLVAVALGAATHVCWDAFTHPGRWGTQLLPVLNRPVAGVPLASWGQYASGVVGLTVIMAFGALALRRARPVERAPRLGPRGRRTAATAAGVALLLGGIGGALSAGDGRVADLAFAAAIGAVDATGAVLIVVGVLLGLHQKRR